MTMRCCTSLLLLSSLVAPAHGYLAIEHGQFVEKHPTTHAVVDADVFLAGINLAWVNFRGDFGSNWGNIVPNKTFDVFESTASQLSQAGGNAIRFWVHCDAANTPAFDAQGDVTGTDVEQWAKTQGRLIGDMQRYLSIAAAHKVKILFSLFNFGIQKDALKGGKLLTDDAALKSYVDHALTPIVQATSSSEGLLGYEVCNEPEGMMGGITGAGWSKPTVSIGTVQKFVNRIAGAIHDAAPKALVTVGSWSLKVVTDEGFGDKGLYNDSSLIASGGHPKGTLDFYEAHWYEAVGSGMVNPFAHTYADYHLSKPLLIGEFSQCCSGPLTEEEEEAAKAKAKAKAASLAVAAAAATVGSPKAAQAGCTSKGLTSAAMYSHLKKSGFHGGLAWQANDHDGPPNGSGVCGDTLKTMLDGIRGAAASA